MRHGVEGKSHTCGTAFPYLGLAACQQNPKAVEANEARRVERNVSFHSFQDGRSLVRIQRKLYNEPCLTTSNIDRSRMTGLRQDGHLTDAGLTDQKKGTIEIAYFD